MSRLTLRLPESLHRHLEALAESEDISLNQYIVYALTRQVAQMYTVIETPSGKLREQKEAYVELLNRLGATTPAQVAAVLAAREEVAPGPDLPGHVVEEIRRRIQAS